MRPALIIVALAAFVLPMAADAISCETLAGQCLRVTKRIVIRRVDHLRDEPVNHGAALQVRLLDPVPAGGQAIDWTCTPLQDATCPAASGVGALDVSGIQLRTAVGPAPRQGAGARFVVRYEIRKAIVPADRQSTQVDFEDWFFATAPDRATCELGTPPLRCFVQSRPGAWRPRVRFPALETTPSGLMIETSIQRVDL